jgi:hypothetical protein
MVLRLCMSRTETRADSKRKCQKQLFPIQIGNSREWRASYGLMVELMLRQ